MDRKTSKSLVILCLLAFVLSGCGYFATKKEIRNAETLLSELKSADGAKLVPYEYCSAEAFLEVSKLEFSENDFKAAKGFVRRSISAAEAGLAEVKKVKK